MLYFFVGLTVLTDAIHMTRNIPSTYTDRIVNDRFGYYSKVDPLYHIPPAPAPPQIDYSVTAPQ